MNRKGQQFSLNSVPQIALLIVVIGMILGAGAIALGSFRDTSTKTSSRTENVTALNSTAVAFRGTDEISCEVTAVYNSTSVLQETATYTYSSTDCTITLKDNSQNDTNYRVDYTATIYKDAAAMLNQTSLGANNFSDQMPVVGTMVGVGIILLIVIGIFGVMKF